MKKIALIILAMFMLLSFVSCNESGEETTSEIESSGVPVSQTAESETPVPEPVVEEPMLLFEYDDTQDVSESVDNFTKLDGAYTLLSQTAQDSAITQWPAGMYDLDDGVVVVYAVDEFDNSTLMIQHINTETGKQSYKLTAELKGTFSYIRDVRDNELYGEADLLVVTSSGAYLFDFDNMSERPEEFVLDDALIYSIGQLSVEDQSGGQYNLNEQRIDIYVPDKKLVYSVNDGIFVSELDGTGEKKILEQPQPSDWFAESDSVEVTGDVNAVYANPRFMMDGTKVICEIKSFDILDEVIGVVVIDLESGESDSINYYAPNDEFLQSSDWTDLSEPKYVGLEYVDESSFDIYHTSYSVGMGSAVRLDCIYDLEAREIAITKINITGITSNFENMVYNEAHKGETGKISFGGFMNQTEYSQGVRLSEATTVAVAMSEDYALVIITNNDRSKSFTILANVVKE